MVKNHQSLLISYLLLNVKWIVQPIGVVLCTNPSKYFDLHGLLSHPLNSNSMWARLTANRTLLL